MISLFGGLTYVNVSRSIEREVDQRLFEQASALASVLTPAYDGSFLVELLPEQVERFQQDSEQAPYYQIWNAERKVVDSSSPGLSIPYTESIGGRSRGEDREVAIEGPGNAIVLVGQSMQQEHQQLRELATTGVTVGAAVLLTTFAGGWFLTTKSLAPIGRISQAAAAISESNLSERIDVTRMEKELAQLSRTINEAFDRLQAAFDRQTRFTADASHELRTPLSIILAHSDLALKRQRSKNEYQDALKSIRRAACRMRGVVEGLLTLARADADELPLSMEPFDLVEILEETCALLTPLVEEKRLTLAMDFEPARIMGDRNRIGEAVTNLLANAAQYNRDGGRIDVKLRAENGYAQLFVADTGPGIPPADQPHVFDRFFRVDKARFHAANRGSGLGLAITKWIAEAHGGTISFTSHEGEGTEFVLSLKLG